MSRALEQQPRSKELKSLPKFVDFILQNYVEDFLKESFRIMRELKVPLLQPLSDAEAAELANTSNLELLQALVEGNPSVHIQKAIDRWRESQFPRSERNQLVVDDVTRISHARKVSFLKFLPHYTSDPNEIIAIVEEIDIYLMLYSANTLHNFVGIIDERIQQHVLRLEESERIYKKAEAIAHIGNWKWDVGNNVVLWTDELYRIYGLEPQSKEMDYETYLSYAHPEDRETIVTQITRSLSTKEPYDFFHRIIVMGGQIKFLHSRGETVSDPDGKVFQLIGSAQDVTALKETERLLIEHQEVLLHRTQELVESNTSLEEFAYVASHDLKEPLRKITVFIELLETLSDQRTEKEKTYLNKVSKAAARMRNMVDDLLDLSLVSAEKKADNISLLSLFQEVLQIFETKIEEVGARVESDHLPVARIVPSQFRQLFQNLIGNSLKFARTGVAPVIKIDHLYLLPSDVLKYSLRPSHRYLQLTFSDNGIGFNNDYGERIFSVFQRLHNKGEYDGTGIGLAICKKIVKNHGGVIFASGQENEGAIFTVIIPDGAGEQ